MLVFGLRIDLNIDFWESFDLILFKLGLIFLFLFEILWYLLYVLVVLKMIFFVLVFLCLRIKFVIGGNGLVLEDLGSGIICLMWDLIVLFEEVCSIFVVVNKRCLFRFLFFVNLISVILLWWFFFNDWIVWVCVVVLSFLFLVMFRSIFMDIWLLIWLIVFISLMVCLEFLLWIIVLMLFCFCICNVRCSVFRFKFVLGFLIVSLMRVGYFFLKLSFFIILMNWVVFLMVCRYCEMFCLMFGWELRLKLESCIKVLMVCWFFVVKVGLFDVFFFCLMMIFLEIRRF